MFLAPILPLQLNSEKTPGRTTNTLDVLEQISREVNSNSSLKAPSHQNQNQSTSLTTLDDFNNFKKHFECDNTFIVLAISLSQLSEHAHCILEIISFTGLHVVIYS